MSINSENSKCLIWGTKATVDGSHDPWQMFVRNSARAGGAYRVYEEASHLINRLDNADKARLTTWLIDQQSKEGEAPEVTADIVEYIQRKQPLSVHERAERLLRFIEKQSNTVGGVR